MVFPPYSIVQYSDGKLCFSAYDGMPDSLRGREITSIDGHPASEVVDSILDYIGLARLRSGGLVGNLPVVGGR